MKSYDVIVCGNVSVDIVFSEIKSLPAPGEEIYCDDFEFTCGAAYNTAVALSRLGLKVAVVGSIGSDFLSQFVLKKMQEENVSTELMKCLDYPKRTVSAILNYGGDRSFVSYEDETRNFELEPYINSIINNVDADVLHISANQRINSTIDLAKKINMTVSLDVGWDEEWLKNPELKQIIMKGDLFTPNLKEALTITGESDPIQALDKLDQLNPNNTVIIKLGGEGSIFRFNDSITKTPAEISSVVDTTGAGDVFVGGVITGFIKNFNLKKAVQLGTFCAGHSVEGLGGTKKSPYWSQVKGFF